jgi:predicted RNA-binding protein associated with RNAse of E/G family
MRKWQILLGGAALGLMVMTGCTAQMTQADRDLLNQALESGQMAAQEAQKAQASAGMASDAAARAETAAERAETAAAAAEKSAAMAADSAMKCEKAFEMGQMK